MRSRPWGARSWDDDPARVARRLRLRDDGAVGVPRPSLSFVDDDVRVDVAHDPLSQPRLRIGSARGGWIRLSFDGRTLAYARHELHWQGLAWLRMADGAALQLLPPITSALARATPPSRWAAHFARALFLDAASPILPAGAYALAAIDASNVSGLREVERPYGPPFRMLGARELHLQPRAMCLSWSWRPWTQANVLALREAAPSSAARPSEHAVDRLDLDGALGAGPRRTLRGRDARARAVRRRGARLRALITRGAPRRGRTWGASLRQDHSRKSEPERPRRLSSAWKSVRLRPAIRAAALTLPPARFMSSSMYARSKRSRASRRGGSSGSLSRG